MEVVYQTGGNRVVVNPALLVIACDPRALGPVMEFTPQERALLSSLRNFTFYTTCLRVYPRKAQDRVVILAPDIVESQSGLVQGYRNETAKQWGITAANDATTNVVTTYQMVGIDGASDPGTLAAQRKAFLDNPPSWWPFQPGRYEIVEVKENQNGAIRPAVNPLLTPYFNQFPSGALDGGAPWKWLDIQGAHDTVYVHASTCFESVLHCWSYLNILLDVKPALLSTPKDAAIVVIGAGVSGLLFAQRFIDLGYTDVTLLESTNRFAGKTHSLQVPDQIGISIAELGTCYLSPAYDDMVQSLSKYIVGNARVAVAHGSQRGIVVGSPPNETVMDFNYYGLMIACQYLGYGWPCSKVDQDLAYADLFLAAANYVRLRTEIFGTVDGAMPISRPVGDPYGVFSKTFAQFLDDNMMGALKGYLMYAYQVQGYGDLDKIPAYYGLVWVMPDMAWPFGASSGVTAWQKGWEDVWDQMVKKCTMNIKLNTNVVSIRR
ncbi:NAD(P)-binding protein [Isoptericola sp. NEAU-Y5]|uniref:NAD(P)-binding protein n=1 Tax=Isoptericola luteus TaxID=2879484 RepID=A0ABS7ZGX1_9MICO|nr:NAD(P)-binding protein [Isoptericola sp. NEAU-Y5]MCA5894163.1 NAD(P)-binding protein [Isoptericola sp. NEAU-Y5]